MGEKCPGKHHIAILKVVESNESILKTIERDTKISYCRIDVENLIESEVQLGIQCTYKT